jgi:hypothetical protein
MLQCYCSVIFRCEAHRSGINCWVVLCSMSIAAVSIVARFIFAGTIIAESIFAWNILAKCFVAESILGV